MRTCASVEKPLSLSSFEVEGHAAFAVLLRQQLIVHIVPILVVVFEKILEVRLVVDDKALDALLAQQLADRLQTGAGGVDMQLQPLHRCVPTKNSPSVPQPVCARSRGR